MKNEDRGGEYGSSLPLSLCSDCQVIKTGPKRSPRGPCQADPNHSETDIPKSVRISYQWWWVSDTMLWHELSKFIPLRLSVP